MSEYPEFEGNAPEATHDARKFKRDKSPVFDSYILNGKFTSLSVANINDAIYKVDNFVWRICN
jgi:hypothetical protein